MRSNSPRVSFSSRCSGPSAVAVTNGRLIVVSATWESSIFAFSAASFRRCSAIRSFDRSTPWSSLNSFTIQSMTRWSQSSPPSCVSPWVALTSNTPSPISSSDTSNVPPPRSKTRIVWSLLLVEPVGERGGRRLVDDAEHLEARDLAGLLRGLALRVVEVRGHRDDRLGDGVAEVRLGVALQLAQDLGADLLGRSTPCRRPRGTSPSRPCAASPSGPSDPGS